MNIICLTKEKDLEKKIAELYQEISLNVFDDFKQINKDDLQKCDIIVVDLKDCLLPGKSFFSPILALSQVPNFDESLAVLKCGAKGYGNRHMRASNLKLAIDSINSGNVWLPPAIVAKLIETTNTNKQEEQNPDRAIVLDKLSKREQEVAIYIGKGESNQEIADKLFVSTRTVKAHLSSIYSKTGMRNRLELGLQIGKV